MITTNKQLAEFAARALESPVIAVDTEFVWERTYYPQLGLVQLGLSDTECRVVDVLRIEDFSPLGDVLAAPHVVKILHDCQQDLCILHRLTGRLPVNVFDTRLAGGFAGFRSTLSLQDLLQGTLDIQLAKTQTRTNWLQRPLSAQQEEYARDDVRYLPRLREELMRRADARSTLDWMNEEMTALSNPALYREADPDMAGRRFRGINSMKPAQAAVLRGLAAWREQEARRRDRPRGHIARDSDLLAISRARPQTVEALRCVQGPSSRLIHQHGDVLVGLVKQALTETDGGEFRLEMQSARPPRNRRADKASVDRVLAHVQMHSDPHGIDPQLVATRQDVETVMCDERPWQEVEHRLVTGWRRHFADPAFEN